MTKDEKAQQIERLIQEHQEAKSNLARLERKILTVSDVYSEVGKVLSYLPKNSVAGFEIKNGHFDIPHSRVSGNIAANLLNESELLQLLVEYNSAKEQVSSLYSQLLALDITGMQQ
jgi:hypothetical protein